MQKRGDSAPEAKLVNGVVLGDFPVRQLAAVQTDAIDGAWVMAVVFRRAGADDGFVPRG